MDKFTIPEITYGVPKETRAQAVAANADWQHDANGRVFDQDGVYIADSLAELADALVALGWVVDGGVLWAEIDEQVGYVEVDGHKAPPATSAWAAPVRQMVHQLRSHPTSA